MPSKKPADKTASQPRSSQANGAAISAIDLLEQDHRQVEELFEQYEDLEADDEKEALALKICLALQVHTRIEEEIFYPAARSVLEDGELLDEAIVEHAAAKQLIGEIEAMEVGDQLHDAKVKVLGEQIRHHVEEEEDELFPQLEKTELDLNALGKKLAERKTELLQQVAEQGDAL